MTQKKISRRDAIKLLGAVTGATILANLPSKWSTPQIARGVLPAHAQTSQTLHTLACAGFVGTSTIGNPATSSVTITPNTTGIPMNYSIVSTEFIIHSPVPQNGTVNTVGGVASVNISWQQNAISCNMYVTWSFANASNGSDSCIQHIQYAPT